MTANEVSGIILAGGRSSRMGQDKGLVVLNGKALVEHVLEVIREVCSDVMIIAGNVAYKQFGAPVYHDIFPGKGPAAGIHAGITHSRTHGNLVVGCDMPFLSPGPLRHILQQNFRKHDAVIPVYHNRIQPLCGLYSRNCLADIERMILKDQLKMQDILTKLKVKYVNFDPIIGDDWRFFYNVNTLRDIRLLR